MAGWNVAWETFGYHEEAKTSEMVGGQFDLSHWGVVSVAGPDAKDFLQRMSTAHLLEMRDDDVVHTAFLTGKGTVISLGMMLVVEGEYLLIVPPGNSARLAEHLEQFHFGENLAVTDRSSDFGLIGLWLHESTNLLKAPVLAMKRQPMGHGGRKAVIFGDDSREALHFQLFKREDFEFWWKLAKDEGLRPLGEKLFEYYRVSHGVPQVGVELGETEIILEGNFDRAVARSKGCYPGQEVVERIFTYGRVNRKLHTLEATWNSDPLPSAPFVVTAEGKAIITVVSIVESPTRHATGYCLGFVHKNYWDSNEKFDADNGVTLTIKKA
jgi:folate-binding protein YgfZ